MEKNLNKLKYSIPFILLFLIILIKNYYVGYSHDDITFLGFLNTYDDLYSFNYFRYTCWTSRNIIESVILMFLNCNLWVWRIVDALVYPLIALFIVKLIGNKKYSYISCILVGIFLLSVDASLESTGFLTTTINYTWPLFFRLIYFYFLKEIFNGKKEFIYYVIAIISLILASNNEQLSVIIFGIHFFLFLYLLYKKINIPKFFYLAILIVLLIIINAFICPGNYNRINVALRFYPWYADLSIADKFNIGFSHIMNWWIATCDLISLVLFALLGIYNYLKKKRFFYFIPLVIASLFTFIPSLNHLIVVNVNQLGYNPVSFNLFLISFIVFLIFFISLIYCFISIFLLDKKFGYLIGFLFIISLASAIMYGFTPSILSMKRMYIFSSACNMFISFCLIIKISKFLK